MLQMIMFFCIGIIGIGLRFLILGKFEWYQLFIVSLFLLAAFIFRFIEKWQKKRDEQFKPHQPQNDILYTYMMERFSTGRKLLFKGNQKIGEYSRIYSRKWHQWMNQLFLIPGWHLNLIFTLHDRGTVKFIKKKISPFNQMWHIVENGQVIGTVKTDVTLKNSAKLKEQCILQIYDETFIFRSLSIQSRTEVLKDDRIAAIGTKPFSRFQYQIQVEKEYHEIEPYLMMTYILFNYAFKQ